MPLTVTHQAFYHVFLEYLSNYALKHVLVPVELTHQDNAVFAGLLMESVGLLVECISPVALYR